MIYLLLILAFICSCKYAEAQTDIIERPDFTMGINGGMVVGGPIPTKSNPDLSGSLTIGPHVGVYADYRTSNLFSIESSLNFAIKGVTISGRIRRDTIVEVNIGGQSGYIPTFYTADITGKMSLQYLDLPVMLSYNLTKNSNVFIGGQASLLVGGEYATEANVVVGEGGFYDDVYEKSDMYDDISRYDLSICIGGAYRIFRSFTFKFYGTRSIIPFNKPGTGDPETTGNLYNTYFITAIVYEF